MSTNSDRRLALLAAERDALLERLPRDVLPDLAAEEVAQLLALAQPGTMRL